MKRNVIVVIVMIVLMLGLIGIMKFNVSADGFDPIYYGSRYPDVVNELGMDPAVLYNHYMTFGIYEGRFQNAQEEAAGVPATPPQQQQQVPQPTVQDPQPVQTPTPAEVTILPGYSTYIDVDITNQLVTYFENGETKFQSPCVSGNVNAGRGTPTGIWSIMCKVPGKYLVGPTWRCWVDRWMQFTPSACGFHDANWRSSFGGDIYLSNGSHGCVNLPHDSAVALYDMISVGTTVVVH